MTEMKSNIYDQFQLENKIRTNKNLHTKIIKGTKNKPKIKRVRIEMKHTIYNQFQLKDIIENDQNLH